MNNSVFYYIVEFLLAFLLVQLYYKLMARIEEKHKEKKKTPAEIAIFLKLFNIDQRKINYRRLSKEITFINSLSVATTLLCSEIVSNILLKLLIIIIALLLFSVINYKVLGFIYKKKGMTKNV